MADKYISAYRNAGLKKNRLTKKTTQGRVSAYERENEKNRGGFWDGAGYIVGNLGLGLASVGEGVGDIISAGADILRGDTDMAKYRFLNNMSGNAQKRLQEDYNPNGAMKLAGDVASGIGNSLTFLIPYAGPYLAAAGYMGMGVSSAAERTGDVGAKELGYGVVSGSMEFLMDKFIGASGRAYKSIGASITRKMGREAAEAGAKATAKLAGKSFGKAVLTETLKGAAGEALEEASQEALDPLLLRLFNIDENAKLDWKNVAYAGLVGGLSGGLMTAGPAAINYKSAASTGKSIRESGETAEFLEHARLVVKGAQRKQANLTAEKEAAKAAKDSKKANAESGTDTAKAEKTKGGIGTFIQGRRDAKASRRVAQLAETVQKNLTAYEGYLNKADKTAKELEISDAILGEMRGNVFLLENAALLESYEEAILELSDEDKAVLVADINARAKASGAKKTDYTVEDLNKDTDGILAGVAGNLLIRDNYGRYLRGNQKAKAADTSESPEGSPVGAARGAETATGEEVTTETNEGAKEAPAVKREAAPKRKGTVTVSDGMKPSKDFSDTQYAAYKAAEILSDSTGMDIEIHRDLTRDGKTVNGYYDQGTKVLHVNINAMRDGKQIALYTLGHEATHYIKDWSPEKFNVLADFVAKQMGTDMQTAVNEKLSSLFRLGLLKNLTAEQASELAREEVVADGMELIFTDGKVLEELAKTDKTLWQKIRDWFFDMIGQIRNSYRGLNQASKTAQVLRESMETLDEVERLFTEGVREAGERAATAGVETRTEGEKVYSFTPADFEKPITLHDIEVLRSIGRKSINAFTSEDIEKAQKWAYKFYKEMGTKSPFFRAWFGDWRAYDRSNFVEILEMERREGKNPRGTYKNRDTGWVINSSSVGYDETVSHSGRDKKSLIAMRNIDKIIENAILLDTEVSEYGRGKKSVYTAFMHKLYAPIRIDGKMYLAKLSVEESNAPGQSQIDKKFYHVRAIKIETASSVGIGQSHTPIIEDTASDISIADLFAFVKQYDKEFSPKAVNELMLNDDGTPKVFYHGTNADFTVFDYGRIGESTGVSILGDGFYFTDKKEMADRYGKQTMACYVRMSKPYTASPDEAYNLNTDELEKQGYDGVILEAPQGNVYMAFDNSQIKSATDNIGTFDGTNPDIRYSIDDSGEVSESEAADNQAALERFGTTTDFEQAGFAMADGRMLKLSQYGQRGVQHRVIEGIYEDTKGDEAIARFIRNGNVRISAASPGIEISAEKSLTTNQLNVVSRFASKSLAGRGSFYLDITGRDGESIASVAYDDRQSAAAILEDIKDYYKRGRVPEESRYLYSIDEEGENRELSDTELLGMALEGVVQSEQEYKIVSDFREKARILDLVRQHKSEYARQASAYEKQIRELKARMDESGDPDGWIRKAYSDTIAKKREAERMRDEQDSILDHETRELLRLRAAKPFREVIAREQRRAKAAERREQKAKAEYEFREEYKADRREMSVRERAARRVIGRLNTMFYNPTKTKHVPGDLQALVEQVLKSEKLDTFKETRRNLRQMAELEREIEKLEQNPARTASEQERLDKMLYKYAAFEDEGLAAKGQAEALFTAFKTWMESKPKEQQDQALLDKLSSEIDGMQDMPLSRMSKESLISVENFYKMIYHQVNNANQTFATERALNIDELGSKASSEVQATKALKFLSPKGKEWKAMDGIRQYFWKNMKPLTVFEAIGSKTYTDLFQRVLDAEGVWAKDIQEAREKIVKAREEHGYKAWDLEAREAVKTKSGTVDLSLSERMALYAYAKRHQAVVHLETGGFVLDPRATVKEAGKVLTFAQVEKRLNDSTRYVLDEALMGEIESTLTAEQKAYVDEMQKYLTDMGKKGNEVSRKLYGIDIFNEEFYFPIKVKSEYLNVQTGKTGDPNIKNRGMTKEVVPGAENPLVLQGFDEVMTEHMNSMATYHAFVLPVEDLTRVLNYQPANYLKDADGNVILDDKGKPKADPDAAKDFSTLKAVIESKYGAEANSYVVQLVRDLNGGARRDAAVGLLDRGITAFKRASTMASLSVMIQQPTSIVRAGAYIDYKYLMGSAKIVDFKNHKELWERVKKYAPVAVIKEMGGYDTGVGLRTSEYLNAQEYGKGERVKGFLSDANYRAEIFGWGAAYADEMAWIQMFEACTLEQAEKLGKSRDSEEVLTAAGKRFEEIVRHTQVYDSTLTRSEFMRSKDTGMKMATSFMAEPTTMVSMIAEGLMRGERGDVRFWRRTAGAVAGAVILNALAVSLIYAMRDDDEDKTYAEKYLSTLTMELADGINPAGYLPVARDIVSIMQGYEVERSDMTLVQNLFDQVGMITSSKRSVTDKVFGVSGALAAFFGVPLTNVYRDAKGVVNTLLGQADTETTTGAGLSAAVKEEFNTIFKLFDKQTTNGYQLYKAFVSGDTAHYNRVAARYESEAAVEQALRRELRERDRRIGEAAEARMAGELDVYESIIEQIEGEGIFERNMIIRAINNEINSLKDDAKQESLVPKDEEAAAEDAEEVLSLYSTTDLNDALERGDREDYARIYQTLVTGKTEQGKTEAQAKAAVKSSVTAYWKKRYIAAWEENNNAEIKRIQSILLSTGLYGSRNDVAKLGQGWVKAYAAGKK